MKKKAMALALSAVLALSSTSAFASEQANTTKACFDFNSMAKNYYSNFYTNSDSTKVLSKLKVNGKSIDLNSINLKSLDCNTKNWKSVNWKSILQKNKDTVTTAPEVKEPKVTKPEVTKPEVTKPEVTTPVKNENTNTTTEKDTTSNTTVSSSNLNYEQKVVELVNIERQKAGLSALTLDTSISNVARTKSQDMADNNYFAHQSPTYGSAGDMLKQFGIKWSAWGENIASGQRSPESVVTAWMNSEGHRANILSSNFSKIGVGYAVNSKGTPYWTQMFTK
ncbi:putative YkwD family protein [Sedimentibacter acidaminivorans]|uniref:YkwD family protein n=1 Tax=Sedimentibacter acidaminivorans TaxID=913099 RepID=A0ABS4GG26_9FIRM|nr:CAP domain-containing protein [Sedimentibacter acidaminivorans]MBP1926647.1 putative YkwD family protein [Sedimentibacter acidaminivorans]